MIITYEELVKELKNIQKNQAVYLNKNVVATKLNFLGIYTKTLKELAKKYMNYRFIDFKFNEYYEINFIYAYSNLLRLQNNLDEQVKFIFDNDFLFDSWSMVDYIAPLLKNSTLETSKIFINSNKEFIIRFGYVILLSKVNNVMMINEAFNIIISDSRYYVKMVEAWLISVCLVNNFEESFKLLKKSKIDYEVKRISIQKAIDSFRISNKNKLQLKEYRNFLKEQIYD